MEKMSKNQKLSLSQRDLVLACMAVAKGEPYRPVQIQKLIFLFQEKAADYFDERPFRFVPHNYGPYTQEIYSALRLLEKDQIVIIDGDPLDKTRAYRLNPSNADIAEMSLKKLPENLRNYLNALREWVSRQSFGSLISAIYKSYPAMKVNSVFKE